MPTFVTVVITFLAQLFISGMLTFLLLEQRRLNREIKALTRWLIELDESIPIKGRIPPQQVASFGGTHSGEGQKRPYQ